MSSRECKEIERELNIILRDLKFYKTDASGSSDTFPVAGKYESDFPPLNHSTNKIHKNSNIGIMSHTENSLDSVQEGRIAQTFRKPKERVEEDMHLIRQHDGHSNYSRKQKDQPARRRPQANRNTSVNKLVPNRFQNQKKHASNYMQEHSVTLLDSKRKEKEKQVIGTANADMERKSVNSVRKLKNFGHLNREKKRRADPSGGNDEKIQANIFFTALTGVSTGSDGKTSSTVETTKRDRPKKSAEDKLFYEPEVASYDLQDEISAASHCKTAVYANGNRVTQARKICNSDSTVRTTSDSSDMSNSPVKNETQVISSVDEFIRRCNKPDCKCSEESLYCTLCDFHMDNRRDFERHRKQVSHDLRKKNYFRIESLKALSPPSSSSLCTIEKLLVDVYTAHVQGNDDSKLRNSMIEELREDLYSEVERECSFHLFGSSVNGFGLKNSNVNIDLEVPQGISPSQMLLKSLDALKERECKYGNITSDFSATFPSISFIHRMTKLQCEIILTNNDASRKTTRLLKQYAQFDHRAQMLGTIFRIWAKVCGIDQQESCSLPPHCFPLMTIYFLQQTHPPVLPVLHELAGESDPLLQDFRGSWISRNTQKLGELWVNLLKFYATNFDNKAHVISICQTDPLLCKDKKWTTRMICIEDPYHAKRNLARSIGNLQWFQYILECIRSSYEYFCTCRVPQGEILTEVNYLSNLSNDEDEDSLSTEENVDYFLEDQDKDLQIAPVLNSIKNMDLGFQAVGTSHRNGNRTASEQCQYVECGKIKGPGQNGHRGHGTSAVIEQKHSTDGVTHPSGWEISTAGVREHMYKFEKAYLINVEPPVLYCRQCQKPSHVKKNCPVDENLPELKKLPKMEKDHRDMLTDVCKDVFCFCQPSQRNKWENDRLLNELGRHIQSIFPDAQLELFGSSCNGFGFDDSDLDICLTFFDKTADDLDQKVIIEKLAAELNNFHRVRNVIPIPTAKVPIVKLSFAGRKEGDISLYNTLAQHNTRLLSTYCKIDERVQPLGYALKFFAKRCDICDASRGSLSSYAYILMTIFYLQQLEVPVIPVLQELYDKNDKMPERHVDNWNTWFFDDLSQLPNAWKEYGQNKQPLGELWMGLLLFYTEKFNIAEYVISIRQKAPLTRFEKLWNTRSIAIEDPFDLSHNLGAGVSRNMNTFILSAFRRGRECFGRIPPARRDIPCLLEHFFNSSALTGGKKPPNERGCKLCLKIGHKVKECPLRRNRRSNVQRRNYNNKPQLTTENKNRFTDRSHADRRVRGMFQARNNQDRCDPRTPSYNSRTQNS